MSSRPVFKGNLEVETIQTLIFGLTTFFVFIGLVVDILTEQKMVLWLVFLTMSFFLFLAGFFAKYFPRTVVLLAISILIFTSVYTTLNLFIIGSDILVTQIITLIFYVLTMIVINILTLNTLSSGMVVDSIIKKRITNKMTTYSKLRRRKSRRNSSKTHMSTSIKSGTYCG